jgi:hypothetical protein
MRAYSRLISHFAALALCGAAPLAHGAFQIETLYSSLDGTVQYVVLHETAGENGQQALHGLFLQSTHAGITKTYYFTNDLPSSQTANQRVLIATRGFAALGLIVPDYVVPDQFLTTTAGELTFAYAYSPPIFMVDRVVYSSLPTDGANALTRNGASTPNVATNFAGATANASPRPINVVEYYAPSLDHYFITALQPEIDALDTGAIPGWRRTGFGFKAFASPTGIGAGANPVCRFYIPPALGDSHFFSAAPDECGAVLQKMMTDPLYAGYIYETPNLFYIALPDRTTGACPAGTIPVYRLWNQRVDSNHRYTTDPAIKAQMIAAGYAAEGYGPDDDVMCAPSTPVTNVQARVSATSAFAPGCDGAPVTGTLYTNAEVEPMVAVNPRNPANIVGVWQQDRWSDGGAPAMLAGASTNAGQSWTLGMAAFTRCAGGNAANGGNYPRSSDPWVTFGPDGTVYQIAIAFSGGVQAPGSTSAILASRSVDGGQTWAPPSVLISDVNNFFNDKDSITADSTDARLVYAVWDRLTPNNTGPAMLARSTDGGVNWEAARVLYDPGVGRQTLNNQIVVLADGTLIDFFTQLDAAGTFLALQIVRSTDKGLTWSAPITISAVQTVGTTDPATGAHVRDGSTLGAIAAGPRGELAVVWQDARFSGGLRDGIAFSRSLDGGFTWSAPAAINGAPGVPAFIPSVSYRSDGTVGVTYYDFRGGAATASSLPTDYWLTRSGDGIVWREAQVTGPFDLATAPIAEGLFLGDYQSLASYGEVFLPFFVRTNSGDLGNRTDVFASLTEPAIPATGQAVASPRATAKLIRAQTAPPLAPTPELSQRLRDNVLRAIQRRRQSPGG